MQGGCRASGPPQPGLAMPLPRLLAAAGCAAAALGDIALSGGVTKNHLTVRGARVLHAAPRAPAPPPAPVALASRRTVARAAASDPARPPGLGLRLCGASCLPAVDDGAARVLLRHGGVQPEARRAGAAGGVLRGRARRARGIFLDGGQQPRDGAPAAQGPHAAAAQVDVLAQKVRACLWLAFMAVPEASDGLRLAPQRERRCSARPSAKRVHRATGSLGPRRCAVRRFV